MAIAGLMLCSRRLASRQLLKLVDWQLLTLFCSLFVVIGGVTEAGLPARLMASLTGLGIDLGHLPTLTVVSTALSNLVSNVPATMLLVNFLGANQLTGWYTLALSSTFAGNLILLGSIANLIVVEQAEAMGVKVGFIEHARTGIPVTVVSLLALLAWIGLQARL